MTSIYIDHSIKLGYTFVQDKALLLSMIPLLICYASSSTESREYSIDRYQYLTLVLAMILTYSHLNSIPEFIFSCLSILSTLYAGNRKHSRRLGGRLTAYGSFPEKLQP